MVMGQGAASHQSRRPMGRAQIIRLAASFFSLAIIFVMNACGSNAGIAQTEKAVLAQADHRGPDSTNSTLLIPRHYDRQRVQTIAEYADQIISKMTLDEELGQLFVAEYVGTDFNANNAAMIEQMHAGGIILYAFSMHDAKQTQALIAASQAHVKIPLLVTVDEEGGCVDRLAQIYGPHPGAPEIGATGSTTYAYQQGAKMAKDMSALGFNVDLAPDVDVKLVNGRDLLCRTYGSTPGAVTKMAGAYLDGLQDNGVVGTLKHFPGLGDALEDAHLSLPVINRTRDQIESVELAPYRAMIDAGKVQMVMTTDLLMPALDPVLPAELSPNIITGVLRNELGFDGVVMTDALYMDGISNKWSMPQAGVLAIQAGCDMLLGPWSASQMRAMVSALKGALKNGSLTKARIDQSVERILLLKMRMGLISLPANSQSLLQSVPPLGSMSLQFNDAPVADVPGR